MYFSHALNATLQLFPSFPSSSVVWVCNVYKRVFFSLLFCPNSSFFLVGDSLRWAHIRLQPRTFLSPYILINTRPRKNKKREAKKKRRRKRRKTSLIFVICLVSLERRTMEMKSGGSGTLRTKRMCESTKTTKKRKEKRKEEAKHLNFTKFEYSLSDYY